MGDKRKEVLSESLFEKDSLKWVSGKNRKSKKSSRARDCQDGTKECKCGRICQCESICKCGRPCFEEN